MAAKRPHFSHPPIIEQAITVVFEPLPLAIVDIGLFWSELDAAFPRVEAAARAETMVETFEGGQAAVGFNIVPAVQLPRTVFRNDAGEVVQLQDDRFTFNWIKSADDDEYPRFDRTLPRFEQLFGQFQGYLKRRGLPEPALQQCELTNMNIVPVADFGDDFTDMSQAFVVPDLDLQIPGLESEPFVRRRQHRIVNKAGEPLGRLHVTLAPVFRNVDQQKAIQFEITARSAPGVSTLQKAHEFFDIAHDMINAAFVATVTPKMRKLWGEYDGE